MSDAIAADNVIIPGQAIDFGKAASDYATYRAGFPPRFFERIAAQVPLRAGMAALDLGTGTGTVARGLARHGLAVDALDPSDALMEQARALDAAEDLRIAYHVGRAEALPFADQSFDLVTAGQCWHWFDRPQAAREIMRVLKPGGAVILCHFDWLPLPGNMVEATEALILAYNPDWRAAGGDGIPAYSLADLSGAGFKNLETASFDVDQPYNHEGWRGRIRASAGIKASLDLHATERFDAELAALLAARFPDDPMLVPHRCWWVIGRNSA